MHKFKLIFSVLFPLLLFFGIAKNVLAVNEPVILYTDITSGPNTGGENNNGAIVSIFGKNFGNNLNDITVYVGGGQVVRKVYFGPSLGRSDIQQLAVQLGPSAATGSIQVFVNGVGSNTDITFTVRSGNIYYAAVGGNDNNNGSYSAPWEHLDIAKSRLSAGDILYALDGVAQTAVDSLGGNVTAIRIVETRGSAVTGTEANPIAVVCYPGGTCYIGNADTGPTRGINIYFSWWTFSGFHIVSNLSNNGSAFAILEDPSHYGLEGNRLVNCNLTGAYYTVTSHGCSHSRFLGNTLNPSLHSMFYYTGSGYQAQHDIEIAWNYAHDGPTTDGFPIKIYYAPPTGYDCEACRLVDDVRVHDNLVVNGTRSSFLIGGKDTMGGAYKYPFLQDVLVYNNIVYGQVSGYAFAFSQTQDEENVESEANYELYNNTVYLGSGYGSNALSITSCKTAIIKNNAFIQDSGDYIFHQGSESTDWDNDVVVDHNGYYGGIAVPSEDANPITGNPFFADAVNHNFRLTTNSPYINSGIPTGIMRDFDGISRPQGSGYDIGAFEYDENTPADMVAPAGPGGLSVR